MAELTFYTNPQSRGRIARWMLEEVGVDYDTTILAYGTTIKAPEYLAINPMGKVPAIKHGTRVVTEAAAICAYLADAFPDAGLAPDVSDRSDYYRWLFYAAGPLEQAALNQSLNWIPTPEETARVGYGTFDTVVDVLEKLVTGKQYVAGDNFSAADVYLGAQLGWGLAFGWLPKRDAFESYVAGLMERPAYKSATEKDDALVAADQT